MIARVFPRQTSMTPTDDCVHIGGPDMFTPHYEEAHISCVFTWDIERCKQLEDEWQDYAYTVKVGGPAFGDPGGEFTVGRYCRSGVTITSRGCPNKCSFCYVPKREGGLRELEIQPGNIIHDNNILACSRKHWDGVVQMLHSQQAVGFNGGLEAARLTDAHVDDLRGLNIHQLFFAYDSDGALGALKKAVGKCGRYFKRYKLRCYVLIGYRDDTIEKATHRLEQCWEVGCLPFAMLYRDDNGVVNNTAEWRALQKTFARPAATKAYFRDGRRILYGSAIKEVE